MSEKLANIDVKLLMPSFVLLRLVDKTSLDYIEMRDSIAAHGFFGSICVRVSIRHPGKYEVINGLHRYCCALDCGLETVPCIIKEATDAEVKNWQVQANLIRRETTNAEYAARLKMLFVENPELTLEVLSVELHCRPQKLQDILRLNRLIPEAKKHLDVGNLPLTSAYSLCRLPKQLQEDLVDKALSLSAREFVQLSNGYSKAFREAIYDGKFSKYLQSDTPPQPHLRSFADVRNEYNRPLNGELILKDLKNSTPIDIWLASLAWVLHLDAESIRKTRELAVKRAETEKDSIVRRVQNRAECATIRQAAKKMGIDPSDQVMIEGMT